MTDSTSDIPLADLLPRARGLSESKKAAKTIGAIASGKATRDERRAAAGFYVPLPRHSRDNRPLENRPERDVMAAAIDALEDGDVDYPDKMATDYTEAQMLTLLERGLPRDVTADTGFGPRTLLGFAALADYVELAERLLDEGADPNQSATKAVWKAGDPRPARQRAGGEAAHPFRPIDFAWAGGSPRMRELLLARGANEPDADAVDPALRAAFQTIQYDGLFRRLRMSALSRNVIDLPKTPGPSDETRLCSRYGGRPNLDASAWPAHDGEPMLFVGQIHLPELKKPALPLPRAGLLSFFVSAGRHREGRVLYQPRPNETVAAGPTLLKGSYPMKLRRPKLAQFAMPNNHYWQAIGSHSLANGRANPYVERDLDEMEVERGHQIGGHPLQIQADPRPHHARQSGGAAESIVPLLQVDQFARSEGMVWGDNGLGHFYCDVDALREGRFEEAWFDWACF